jgi:hypothetical protein
MDRYEDHNATNILPRLPNTEFPCPLIYVAGGYMPMEPESYVEITKRLSKASSPSIVRSKSVSQDLQYLTVAAVDQVSSIITDVFLQPEQYSSEAINCVDGVTVSTLSVDTSGRMQMRIRRMIPQEWMKLLKTDVE